MIGPLTPDRFARALLLNNAHVAELSLLDADRLALLVSRAFWTGCVGDVDGFVLTFDQSADYDSRNFQWFRDRHDRFVYVDRIVVTPASRGRGIARALYEGVLDAAIKAGQTAVMAEVNVMPPNPGSDAFHDGFGFMEIGRATHQDGRIVRYLTRPVA